MKEGAEIKNRKHAYKKMHTTEKHQQIKGEGNGNPLQYSCLRDSHGQRSLVGCCPQGCVESDMTEVTQHACMHALEKEMATHSSVLAWRIPGTVWGP